MEQDMATADRAIAAAAEANAAVKSIIKAFNDS